MQTRSKNNIQKPKQFTDGTIPYPPPKALITESVVAEIEPPLSLKHHKALIGVML
jgi:hypothetical protein